MSDPVWQFALPPLRPGAGFRERKRHHRAEKAVEQRIRRIWVGLCSNADLVERLGSTDGESWTPPQIGPITLGPPTRFSVCLRPGQVRADLERVRGRIADAYRVQSVIIRDLVPGWVTVELVENGASGVELTAPDASPDRGGLRRPRRLVEPPTPRHPFPRQATRGPSGGPATRRKKDRS